MKILLNNIKYCFEKIKKHSQVGIVSIHILVSFDVDSICALKILIGIIIIIIKFYNRFIKTF
jgi:hypothetical protein